MQRGQVKRRNRVAALVACMAVGSALAQPGMRLESAKGEGAADCYEQIRKARPPEFDPRGGLSGGVDNSDWAETSVVLVRLTFRQASTPPDVEVLHSAGNPKLVPVVQRAVKEYRMSCLPPGEQEVIATRLFVLYGVEAPVLQLKRELALVDVVRLVKELPTTRVRFDFSKMACPFKVEFAPFQPYAKNTVNEVGTADANRREFLDWLRNVTLDLPPKFMRTAMGASSVVAVPCTVLDLS